MRSLLTYAFFGIALVAACGGRTADPNPSTGSGGTAGAGGTTTGTGGGTTTGTGGGTTVGGTGGGTTVGGTGGGMTVGGTGGTGIGGKGGAGGAGGAIDAGIDFSACSGTGQCVLASATCCSCGILGLNQLVAINSSYRDAYSKQICGSLPPCPPCVGVAESHLMARCESGRCRGFDIRTDPTYTKCGSDQECVLRKGLGCCQCTAEGDWVAMSRVGDMLVTGEACAPMTACPGCIPVPPAGLSAVCRNGACTEAR